jgi:hypothetical protein
LLVVSLLSHCARMKNCRRLMKSLINVSIVEYLASTPTIVAHKMVRRQHNAPTNVDAQRPRSIPRAHLVVPDPPAPIPSSFVDDDSTSNSQSSASGFGGRFAGHEDRIKVPHQSAGRNVASVGPSDGQGPESSPGLPSLT